MGELERMEERVLQGENMAGNGQAMELTRPGSGWAGSLALSPDPDPS